jgi:hypothetical protein
MRTLQRIVAGALAGAGLLLTACAVAPPPTPVEREYGVSHHLAVFGQIADPAAEKNRAPVAGVAGTAAQGAYRRYLGSFGPAERVEAVFAPAPAAGAAVEVREKTAPDYPAAGKTAK